MSGGGNSKWLSWFDRVVAILLLLTHASLLYDHYKNYVRASLTGWIPPVTVIVVYVLYLVLYVVRISRHKSSRFKLFARLLLALWSISLILIFISPSIVVTQLPSEDMILVADVENKTGDAAVSGDVLKKTLIIALKESPQVAILTENRLQDSLRRMGKAPNEPVTVSVAREVAIQEGVGLLIAPAITRSDNGYYLEAQAVDPKTGQSLYETTVGPYSRERLATEASEALAQDLRNKFGESLLHLYRTSKPLGLATSNSQPALDAYYAALKYLSEVKYSLAEDKLKNAVALDPNFAMAWTELASIYEQEGNLAAAIACSSRAFSLRDRLTEPERARVDDFYYWHVENNHQKAFTLLTEYLARYPKDQDRFGSLAYEASMLMRFDVAEENNLKALGKRPWGKSAEESAYDLWDSQVSHDDLQQALQTINSIKEDIPRAKFVPYLSIILKLANGERDAADLEIVHLRQANNMSAAQWLSGLRDIYAGKLHSAFDQWLLYARSVEESEKSEMAETPWMSSGKVYLALARIALLTGRKQEAVLYLKKVRDVRDEYLAEAGVYYARLGKSKEAQEILDELKTKVAGRETDQNLALLQLLGGEIEIANNNPNKGFTLISSAASYPWKYLYLSVHESLGDAARASGHHDVAIEAFKAILDKKNFAADRPEAWIMATYNIGRSYEAAGNKSMALTYYLQFEHLWGDGDATLPELVDVRNRLAGLKR